MRRRKTGVYVPAPWEVEFEAETNSFIVRRQLSSAGATAHIATVYPCGDEKITENNVAIIKNSPRMYELMLFFDFFVNKFLTRVIACNIKSGMKREDVLNSFKVNGFIEILREAKSILKEIKA